MDVEFGMNVVDKNGKAIGKVGRIFIDDWTGKPRKYLVRQEKPGVDAVFTFASGQIGEVSAGGVKLSVALEELD